MRINLKIVKNGRSRKDSPHFSLIIGNGRHHSRIFYGPDNLIHTYGEVARSDGSSLNAGEEIL